MTFPLDDTTYGFDVSEAPEMELAGWMRGVASRSPDAPPAWALWHGGVSATVLTVGLGIETGAVLWEDQLGPQRPADGAGVESRYWYGLADPVMFPAGTELAADRVLRAVVEYARTGQRPKSLSWVQDL